MIIFNYSMHILKLRKNLQNALDEGVAFRARIG